MKKMSYVLVCVVMLLYMGREEVYSHGAICSDRSRQIMAMHLLIDDLNFVMNGDDLDREKVAMQIDQYVDGLDDSAMLIALILLFDKLERGIGIEDINKAKLLERGWISAVRKLVMLASNGDDAAVSAMKLLHSLSEEGRRAIIVESAHRLKLDLSEVNKK